MNRTDLQRLSKARLREACILLDAGEYSGAYYLSGYAVECGLKACFAKAIKRYDFPDKKNTGRVFTHRLIDLVTLADLESALLAERQANPVFAACWEAVRGWTEESRYSTWSKEDAHALIGAMMRKKDGVMPWIRRYW